MGQTSHKQLWEKSFPWFSRVKANKHLAYCNFCKAEFRVDGSGRSHVAHAGGEKHVTLVENSKDQRQIESNTGSLVVASSTKSYFISDEDAVTRAEALHALHIANYNISFFSASEDNAR